MTVEIDTSRSRPGAATPVTRLGTGGKLVDWLTG
jgi:hypothetical protein